jgi:hypothetical protein
VNVNPALTCRMMGNFCLEFEVRLPEVCESRGARERSKMTKRGKEDRNGAGGRSSLKWGSCLSRQAS